jgi:predicted dehydrogenase
MRAPISLLVLGAGFSRSAHGPALRQLPEDYRVAGVFSRSEAKAQAMAQEFPGPVHVLTDLDEALALPGVEAVDVALPILPASRAVEAALARGLHVFSEKPIAESVERGRALRAQHEERLGTVWCVAESFRFWSTAWKVRDLIAAGEIGTPLLCHYPNLVPVRAFPFFETEWRRHPAYAGGFLLDGGVHDIAALRVIFGEVEEVSGFVRGVDPELPPADTLAASLRFRSGVLANYSVSYALEMAGLSKRAVVRAVLRGDARAIRDRFGRKHVVGTKGSIFFMHNGVELVRGMKRTRIRIKAEDMMVAQLREFRAGVRDGAPVRNTPREALRDLAVVEAILAAADAREPVLVGGRA